MKTAAVLGGSGFIGVHLVNRLKSEGYWVRVVDLKYPEYSEANADEYEINDLRLAHVCERTLVVNYQQPFVSPKYFDEVYVLASDMGGAFYVFTGDNDANIMTSAMIHLNVCEVLKKTKSKVFFSSSACIYPDYYQQEVGNKDCGLKESMAYPAAPDSEYGFEKLFSERLYQAYARNYGLDIRIARFHNIYGPMGTYEGGREKAPAAICRKVIEADYSVGEIEIWGDGEQTRSFLYIDDCIDAVRLLMESDFKEPINIGSEEMVSINRLVQIAQECERKQIRVNHIDGPQGVRGRNSDNELIRKVLNWEPKVKLKDGIKILYNWIKKERERNS